MDKPNTILTVALVIAVAAIPMAYMQGRGSASTKLRMEFDTALNEFQMTNDVYLETMEERLTAAMATWDLKHRELESRFREAMLNTGVPLEVLDAEPVEPEVEAENVVIPQETYVAIKAGMTYDEVITLVGSEGENSFNLLNEDGTGLRTYTWRWISEEGESEQMNVTFDGNEVSDKHYSDFQF